MIAALCPGSFDPPTNGHVDVIRRSAALCDRLVVAVVANPSKNPLFTPDERVAMLSDLFADVPHVEVESFTGLLVDFALGRNLNVIVKGLRGGKDFDYELQMAQMNDTLAGIETVFLPTSPRWGYVSSSLVREVARLGGDVTNLVPAGVRAMLATKLAEEKPAEEKPAEELS